jgi:hypothetical protein
VCEWRQRLDDRTRHGWMDPVRGRHGAMQTCSASTAVWQPGLIVRTAVAGEGPSGHCRKRPRVVGGPLLPGVSADPQQTARSGVIIVVLLDLAREMRREIDSVGTWSMAGELHNHHRRHGTRRLDRTKQLLHVHAVTPHDLGSRRRGTVS